MYKALVIGDTHLKHVPGTPYLQDQIKSLELLLEDAPNIETVIWLGDIFERRRPLPRELLAFKSLVDKCRNQNFIIIRGNHDSETKADDGVTVLELFDVVVVTDPEYVTGETWGFIPHYEDEEKIRYALQHDVRSSLIFGHFGYKDNGVYESSLDLSLYPNQFILGHLHAKAEVGNITVVGTPYTTSYSEKPGNYYGLVDENNQVTLHKIDFGVRHLTVNLDFIKDNKDAINDPHYFTYLRVILNELEDTTDTVALRRQIYDDLNVRWVEIKYQPVIPEDKVSSHYTLEENLTITDDLIERYVDENLTELSREDIMTGLERLREN